MIDIRISGQELRIDAGLTATGEPCKIVTIRHGDAQIVFALTPQDAQTAAHALTAPHPKES